LEQKPDSEALTLWKRNEVSQWLLMLLSHRRQEAYSRLAVERDPVALSRLQGEASLLNQLLDSELK
jgi:hypothetical protein